MQAAKRRHRNANRLIGRHESAASSQPHRLRRPLVTRASPPPNVTRASCLLRHKAHPPTPHIPGAAPPPLKTHPSKLKSHLPHPPTAAERRLLVAMGASPWGGDRRRPGTPAPPSESPGRGLKMVTHGKPAAAGAAMGLPVRSRSAPIVITPMKSSNWRVPHVRVLGRKTPKTAYHVRFLECTGFCFSAFCPISRAEKRKALSCGWSRAPHQLNNVLKLGTQTHGWTP